MVTGESRSKIRQGTVEVTSPRDHAQSPDPSEAPLPPPRSHLNGQKGKTKSHH